MKLFIDFGFYIREGWANFTRSGMLSLFSILIISISIAVITLFSTVFFNVDHYLKNMKQNPVYSIFLTSDTTVKEGKDLSLYLETLKGVSDVKLVLPDEGMKKLAKRFPLAGEIQKSLEENPLPLSIRLRINTAAAATIKQALKPYTIVESIYSPHFFLSELESISSAVSFFIALIAAILVLASVFTIFNVIRITILARQNDIAIMQLVGADMKYIRAPFAVEGTLQGLSGGILGALFGSGLISVIRAHYLTRFQYLPFLSRITSLPLSYFAGIILLSIAMGLFASTLAASRIDYV
ncbi:MAG: FtsX-like permease family protein [Acidobacteria bacterium]|nr:FtsX-like permease family protein [Acidobacteriota bacterium]